ncbi:hypothetical protein V8G54_026345 [Vigna mungo]|uniref:Cytochrome P450 n=1 Tax=Vigna mungo TaxID=3915 RepID=A0AAQ3N0V3_VIGMU
MASIEWPQEQLSIAFLSSTFYPYFLFFLLAVAVLKLARRSKNKASFNLPPSPRKLPIIGNLHQIGTLPYRSFSSLSQKHGSLMWLQLGQTQTLVISSADLVREIMQNHDLTFSNRPKITAARYILYGGNDIGFSSYGESWKLKRKICSLELLSAKRVQSFRLIREQEVAELVKKIGKATLREASSVNLSELLLEVSDNIICKCALGQKVDSSSVKELARRLMIQLAAETVGDYFPLLSWVDFLTGKIQEFKSIFEAFDIFLDELIEEHKTVQREADHCSTENGFVDILFQYQKNAMPDSELTNDDIKSILMVFLLFCSIAFFLLFFSNTLTHSLTIQGSDTTASTLEWAMAELMRNPTKLKKAQEEVRKIVGNKSKVEENDINQMDYMKCVVKETLRLHPAAPLLIPRKTSSTLKLRGYDIPPKTLVYVNAWGIQRDPEIWERPEEFIPERHGNNHVPLKGQFIPFGFGRRTCPGMTFGLANVEYTLANLLYWFNWKLPISHSSAQDIDMTETYGIVTSIKDMIVAGSDPTASTLEWAMAELMRNSTKLQKAQEEVRKIVGNKSKVEENDIKQMDYMKCVVKETLSPEEFIPERHGNNHVPLKGQYIPFGFGRRACPGMTFGLANVGYTLANLLYWFNWKLPTSHSSAQDIDMTETYRLVTSMKVPLHVKPLPFESSF